MDLSLNEMQEMLADSIEKFVSNDYDFDTRQKYAGSESGFSSAVWQTFAELGWTSILASEEDGGFGGGPVDLMVVMERLGRGLVVEPFLANIVLAGGVLQRAANEQQKADWLATILAGELQTAVAFAEPGSGYEPANITTRAERDGDRWLLHGAKAYVLNGGTADLLIIPARNDGERTSHAGITLFAIPADTPGLSVRDYQTVDGLRAAELELKQVSATDAEIVGEVGNGFTALQAALDDATLAICAEAVGIMNVLTEKTIEFAKSRVQFGVPIGTFQSLQHRMVEMYTACEQSRSLLMWAAMTLDADDTDAASAIHAIKYQVGTAGRTVGEEAVQIHGGMGVTWELDVAHYFKRLTAIGLMFGDADWHLDKLAARRN